MDKIYKIETQVKAKIAYTNFKTHLLIGYFSNHPKNVDELYDLVYNQISFYNYPRDEIRNMCEELIQGHDETCGVHRMNEVLRLKMTEIDLKKFENN